MAGRTVAANGGYFNRKPAIERCSGRRVCATKPLVPWLRSAPNSFAFVRNAKLRPGPVSHGPQVGSPSSVASSRSPMPPLQPKAHAQYAAGAHRGQPLNLGVSLRAAGSAVGVDVLACACACVRVRFRVGPGHHLDRNRGMGGFEWGLIGVGNLALQLATSAPRQIGRGASAGRPRNALEGEGTSEAAPEAVRQAVGGGCQSGWVRLLSVTSAIEAGTCRPGVSGWA